MDSDRASATPGRLAINLWLSFILLFISSCIPLKYEFDVNTAIQELNKAGLESTTQFLVDYQAYLTSDQGADDKIEKWYCPNSVRPDLKRIRSLLFVHVDDNFILEIEKVQMSANLKDSFNVSFTESVKMQFFDILICHEPLFKVGQILLSFEVSVRDSQSQLLRHRRHQLVFTANLENEPSFLVVSHVVETLTNSGQEKSVSNDK